MFSGNTCLIVYISSDKKNPFESTSRMKSPTSELRKSLLVGTSTLPHYTIPPQPNSRATLWWGFIFLRLNFTHRAAN